MNGLQQLDRVTGKPVSPGTIIVQEAAMRVYDDKGRQEISFIGQGKAYVLHGGTITPITWKKAAVRDFTRFYDQRGNPVVFSSKAPTWFQVVAPENPVVFDPPLPQMVGLPVPNAVASSPAAIPSTHVPAPPEGQVQ